MNAVSWILNLMPKLIRLLRYWIRYSADFFTPCIKLLFLRLNKCMIKCDFPFSFYIVSGIVGTIKTTDHMKNSNLQTPWTIHPSWQLLWKQVGKNPTYPRDPRHFRHPALSPVQPSYWVQGGSAQHAFQHTGTYSALILSCEQAQPHVKSMRNMCNLTKYIRSTPA